MRVFTLLGLMLCFLCAFSARRVAAQAPGAGHCDTLGSFVTLGTAIPSGGRTGFLLTDSGVTQQAGAIWNREKVDLNYDFDFKVTTIFCGTADGIAFVLQSGDTATFPNVNGGSLNYYDSPLPGVQRSLAVEMDIYVNSTFPQNDPAGAHINIAKNGEYYPPLTEPVVYTPTFADCAYHPLRLRWHAAAHRLVVYFDGDSVTSYTDDIVRSIFNNHGKVTFGFTASTGGETASQAVRIDALYYNGGRPLAITASGPTRFCLPSSVTLSVANPADYTGYSWSPAAGLDTAAGPVAQAAPTQPTLYVLNATTVGGCPARDSIFINSHARPVVALGPDRTFCTGAGAGETLSVPDAGPGATYTWTPANALSSTTTPTVVANPNVPLRYKVVVRDSGGCTNQGSILLTPSGRVAVSASAVAVDQMLSVTFAPADVQGTVLRYYWDFGDGSSIDSSQSPTHVYAEAGTYQASLRVVFAQGCQVTIPVEAVPVRFRLPNVIAPNGNPLNRTFAPAVGTGALDVQIYNRYGRLVYEQADYAGDWGSGSDVQPGVYYYRLTDAGGQNWRGWLEVAK